MSGCIKEKKGCCRLLWNGDRVIPTVVYEEDACLLLAFYARR